MTSPSLSSANNEMSKLIEYFRMVSFCSTMDKLLGLENKRRLTKEYDII